MKSIFNCFFSVMLLMLSSVIYAQELTSDSTTISDNKRDSIYRGMNLKIDLFNSIYTIVSTSARTSSYEVAVNANLLNRFFPTIELGYANCSQTVSSNASFEGKGFFTRLGADFNLTKNKKSTQNIFFVGLRAAMATQNYAIKNIIITDDYWGTTQPVSYGDKMNKIDAWVEVVGGIQVDVFKNFHMGWDLRFKYLFTKPKEGAVHAWYIPGYGKKADSLWGINYYIGYSF